MVIVDLDSAGHRGRRRHLAGHVGLAGLRRRTVDLIGAVAYGLACGPVADRRRDAVRGHGRLPGSGRSGAAGRRQRHGAGRSRPPPTSRRPRPQQGFEPLGVATGVSGVGAARLAKLTHAEARLLPEERVRRRAGLAPAPRRVDDVVAGGNLAASYSYGDITIGGVGTATSVCDNKVVGFGHPMDFLGETSLSLHPAERALRPAGLARCAVQGGQLRAARRHHQRGPPDRDHRLSSAPRPHGATITSDVSYAGRNRVGSSTVTVPDAWASVAFFQQLANHDRVVDAIRKGSESQSWTIKGSQGGTPFTFSAQRPVHLELRHLLRRVVRAGRHRLPAQQRRRRRPRQRRASTATSPTSSATYSVGGNEQLVKGVWTKVNNRNPATVRAGGKLQLRVVLRGSDGTHRQGARTRSRSRSGRPATGQVFLTGGNDFFSEDFFYDEFGGAKTPERHQGLHRRDWSATTRSRPSCSSAAAPVRRRGGVPRLQGLGRDPEGRSRWARPTRS